MVSNLDCTEDSEDLQKYVLGVDVGTTNIRCYVYDSQANVVGNAQEKINLLHLAPDKVEIEPNHIWQNFKKVVKDSLISAKLRSHQITCMGISTQRNTFVTWDRDTGKPFHNFITWKDKRADKLCQEWNTSIKMHLFHLMTWILFIITRNRRFRAGSLLKFTSTMILMRLVWILKNIPKIREKSNKNEALFGTIDTWLVWKLTKGRVHATDGSNACVTGFFDPFQMKWANWILQLFQIPKNLLPCVKQTSDSFGETHPEIFGSSIPINAVIGDQQSSMFGKCCFNVGDVNCTLGTGSFININTGYSPYIFQEESIYPLVGWTINEQTTYLAECGVCDTGTVILWAQKIGLFNNPWESSDAALSTSDNGNVYYLPAFEKTQSSHGSSFRTSMFIGITHETTKADLVRSILEGLAFQVCSLFKSVDNNVNFKVKTFRVCGGVSKNDFFVRAMANVTCMAISRSDHFDSSSLGAAFLAGLFAVSLGRLKTNVPFTSGYTYCRESRKDVIFNSKFAVKEIQKTLTNSTKLSLIRIIFCENNDTDKARFYQLLLAVVRDECGDSKCLNRTLQSTDIYGVQIRRYTRKQMKLLSYHRPNFHSQFFFPGGC